MSKTVWLQLGLWALAAVFSLWLGRDLADLFEDRRAIYNAEPLERIQGVRAGQRVDPPSETAVRTHEVRRGDTWWSISRQYGVEDPNALAMHNGMPKLIEGMVIEIPGELRKK